MVIFIVDTVYVQNYLSAEFSKRTVLLTCINYSIILKKKRFSIGYTKIQILMFGLAQTSHYGCAVSFLN